QSYLLFLITLVLIFAACSQKESKEDVIQEIEENMNEVEKYLTEADVKITLSDIDDEVIDENHEIKKIYSNDRTNERSCELNPDNSQTINYYATTDATYAHMNDETWQDMTAEE